MACLRGSAARGAGALRQAKPVFAETGHSHKKARLGAGAGEELRNEPVRPAQTMGTSSLHEG